MCLQTFELNSHMPSSILWTRARYPNRLGYFAPYKGTKYNIPEFRQEPISRGKKKKLFNFHHSSLCNIIERSFEVLKNKWRILMKLPSYPMWKQTKIIMACMVIQNFIRESKIQDDDFDRYDHDENYVPTSQASTPASRRNVQEHARDDDRYMNRFRNWIADGGGQ
ncbi:unnamed protein product [Urochloa humidicola]